MITADGSHLTLNATRRRLSSTRRSVTHKFSISGHEGYVTVGFFDDDSPGEMFITIAKEGSTIGGLMNTIGILTSVALQNGVPLNVLSEKLSFVRFEPFGRTENSDIPIVNSIIDYIFRWVKTVSPSVDTVGNFTPPVKVITKTITAIPEKHHARDEQFSEFQTDSPACVHCGSITVRNGNCYLCHNCGESMGCS